MMSHISYVLVKNIELDVKGTQEQEQTHQGRAQEQCRRAKDPELCLQGKDQDQEPLLTREKWIGEEASPCAAKTVDA